MNKDKDKEKQKEQGSRKKNEEKQSMPMDEIEKSFKSLKNKCSDERKTLEKLKLEEAHKTLGLSWKGMVEKYIGDHFSYSYVERQVRAARIERILKIPVGTVPEFTLRRLSGIDDSELISIWNKAASLQKVGEHPTSKHIEAVLLDGKKLSDALLYIESCESNKEILQVIRAGINSISRKKLKDVEGFIKERRA